MRRFALAALVLLLPVVLAGCGSTLASAPVADGAADLVPSSVDLYAVVDGDLEGERWGEARELLQSFPRLEGLVDELLAEHGPELDAALGAEVALAVVNLEYEEAVALTEPDDPAALRRLVDEAGGALAELDRGWWAAAPDERAIQRLLAARDADGALAEREDFERLTGDLPDDALVRIFVRGGPVEDALADLPALPGELGRALECLAAGREVPSAALALSPEEDGVRIDGALDRPADWPDGGDGFENITDTIPVRPLLVAAAASMPEGLDRALACAAGADGEALQLLRLLGGGATSLLSGEVAVAVHPAPVGSDRPSPPTVSLYAELAEEEQALGMVDELAGLVSALVPGLTVEDVNLGESASTGAKVVLLDGEPVLYVGAGLGVLVVSNTERGVAGVLAAGEAPLSNDRRYVAAAEAAFGEPPTDDDALLYLDLEAAAGQARSEGANEPWAGALEPLDTLFLTAEGADDRVKVEGLLAFD